MEQGTFHLIKPKHCNTEYKKKVSLCPSLGSAQSVTTHNLGWYHELNTNIAGKKVKPALSQSLVLVHISCGVFLLEGLPTCAPWT